MGNTFGIVTIFIYTIYAIYIIGKKDFSPSFIFITFNFLMVLGSLGILEKEFEADKVYFVILIYTINIMIALDIFLRKTIFRTRKLSIEKQLVSPFLETNIEVNFQIIITVLLISIALVTLFYYLLGYNIIFIFLKGGVDPSQLTDLRLHSYGAFRFLRFGYIYQLRNIILPICIMYAYILMKKDGYLSLNKKNYLKITLIIVIPLTLIFSIGTGQRGGLIMIFLFVILTLFNIQILKSKSFFSLILSLLFLFSIVSIAIGRSDFIAGATIKENILFQIQEIYERIFIQQQYPQVIGFRYLYTLPTANGAEWFIMLRNLLPNKIEYIPIANIVFEIIYGSMRGTAPPSIWGSIYYNFGWGGVMLCPILIILIYNLIHYKYKTNCNKTIFDIVCYSYLILVLGTWISDGPVYLMNNGLLVIILLYFLATKIKIKFVP